jgi:hypothetical protein
MKILLKDLTQAGINGINLPEAKGRPETAAIETLIDTLNTKKTEMIDSYTTHEANVKAYGVEDAIINEMRKIVFADLAGDAYAPFAIEEVAAPETTPEPASTVTPAPASTVAPAPASTATTSTTTVDTNAATKEAIRKFMYETNSLNSAHKDFVLNLFLELSRGGSVNAAEEDKLKSLLLDRKLIEYKDIYISKIADDTDLKTPEIETKGDYSDVQEITMNADQELYSKRMD